MKDYKNVVVFDHPLIRHKIAILRDERTSMKEFRELVEEITTLMTYESLKDGVPTTEIEVKTPLETCTQQVVKDNAIDIHMIVGKVHIPADEIVSIEHYPTGIDSHRIVGAGMFFGNLGIFDCIECGRHFSLVTDPMDVCIITRKTKRPIVISVKDYSIFNTICPVKEK